MSYIEKTAYHRNIRNEIPNQELAKELAETDNIDGVNEIAEYLYDKNKSISSDCIKVLYETGYLKPELIQQHVDVFLDLLSSKINRMVWGGMIALSTIAQLKADEIFQKIDFVLDIIVKGTVITQVSGIMTLVGVALADKKYKEKLLPILFDYLEKCRPVDFAKRTETILPLIISEDEKFVIERIIEIKKEDLSTAQLKKLKTVLNKFNKKNKYGLKINSLLM